jgi:UDP-2,3-diacylglucosamine pyrophosphatase LpxH
LLKSLRSPDVLTIPEATTRGKPKRVKHDPDASGRRPVNVAIHYLVGNHDWFFHLRGKRADALRRNVVERMGLANSATEPFPHDPDESPVVRELFRQHQVLARHGDIFDPFNYEGDRDASSLGDAIVVELLNRFPAVIEDQLGNVLPRPCLDGLREVDNVRPLLVVPAWVDGLLRRTCPDPQTAKRVKAVWDQLADEFLRLDFVRQRDKWFQFNDLVDKLEWALKFSRGVSIRTLDRMLALWQRFFDRDGQSFHQHAFGEQAFKSRTARHIVYGHTHRHEIMPLDSCLMPGGLYEQMYLNSGTWRRVHELARWQPAEQEFQSYYVMTYLAFFKDGERGGRSFESWSGGLG